MKKLMATELLSDKKVQSFSEFWEQEVHHFIDFIRLTCRKRVILCDKVKEMINNVVCKSSFGGNCKQQDVLIEVLDKLGRLFSGFYVAYVFPEFRFLSLISGFKSKLTQIHKSFDNIFEEIFEERKIKRQSNRESEEVLIDVLFTIKESGDLHFPITNDNIKVVFVGSLLSLFNFYIL